MAERVLITGGAGFIGRAVAAELLRRGYELRILDSLIEQVHEGASWPALLRRHTETFRGDVRDAAACARALRGVSAVVHLAAEVGVGQSMYAIERYTSVNDTGTAVLWEQLAAHPVRRVVAASSMSVYGEGLYKDSSGRLVETVRRPLGRLPSGWDPVDDTGVPMLPVPTPEWKRTDPGSVYALNKYVQERMTQVVARSRGIESVCLRLFNAYGPGQALSNPYTGVLAIFASRLLNGQRPMVFEDGAQRRDFIHVEDVAQAFAEALEHPEAAGEIFNIGSGQDRSIADVARDIARAMGQPNITPEIVGKTRIGDIRHCFCDIAKADQIMGWRPQRDFAQSLGELAEWVASQTAHDRVAEARAELEERGLVA